jgi:inorganic pyrophosphatase
MERIDRLLGVAVHSYEHEDLDDISSVSKTFLSQVEAFFVSYNQQRGKEFKITGLAGRKAAIKLIKAGVSLRKKGRAK